MDRLTEYGMRIGIIAIQHESNTFLAKSTALDDFRTDALLTGEDIREAYANSRHEVGGFFKGLADAEMTAVPILLALATPSGIIAHETFEQIMQMMCEGLDRAGPLDGLLVAPHGAAVSEKHSDADGYWLKMLRERVGSIPIVCTLDPHANVSECMIAACNATISYRTNPHVDQFQTGYRAAEILSKTITGDINPVQALTRPPIAISMDRQETSASPCVAMYQFADELLQQPSVISNSINLGFPYADITEMGSSFVVVCDGDQSLAKEHANRLANWLVNHRQDFACQSIDTEQAIQQAKQSAKPVCLLDMGDNVGGGGPADGTLLLHALEHHRCEKSLACLYDPESVKQAAQTGVGSRLSLRVGGKTDQLHGDPFMANVTVLSLHDGRFTESNIRHGGRTGYDMGPTAVVRTNLGTVLILTSLRVPPFSLGQVTSCGIDPAKFSYIVAKGVNAPIAAYRGVCSRFIRVDTPGVTSANMLRLQFKSRRVPLFPFEDISEC
jgi:microcystin degradation protein MlrC